MEREIKFRGLKDDMSNCNWVYGSLVYSNGIPRISNDEGLTFHSCVKGTEGQYTGLKDKNGVEVYEGDILKVYKPNTWLKFEDDLHEIRFNQKECAFGYFCIRTKDWVTTKNNLINIGDNRKGAWCEVIGNIYENPELIK